MFVPVDALLSMLAAFQQIVVEPASMGAYDAMTQPVSAAPFDGQGVPQSDSRWRESALALVGDLFQRSPSVYWADLLLSACGAWLAATVYLRAPPWSPVQFVSLLASALLFYRAGTFIHEIVHMPMSQMTWFKRAWNLLVGIPLLMPWVIYRNHADHHSHKQFGTPADGEYLPLATSPIGETIKYLAQAPLLPLFMLLRFGVATPVSWLHPKLREWVLTNVSAAVSNPHYRKRFPRRDETHLKMVEVACFAYLATMAVLFATGHLSGAFLFKAYVLLALTLTLNWIRNLAAHRYANAGEQMTLSQQVEDSVNITGQTWLTVALFPVGLRYHALHHMFPALPYHAMGEAHRRLMAGLPADSPYRGTNRESFFAVVRELWQSARSTSRPESSMHAWTAKPGP